MQTRMRKAIGCFVLLAYLGLYVALAATLGGLLLPILPSWASPIFFIVAGVAWVAPLKPLMGWMNRGA